MFRIQRFAKSRGRRIYPVFLGIGLCLNKQKTTHLRFGGNGWFGVFVATDALLAIFCEIARNNMSQEIAALKMQMHPEHSSIFCS